jgi:hypothetical protein
VFSVVEPKLLHGYRLSGRKEAERDTRFVELGRYLCKVRAGQYWLKSFNDFLERRFRESRRKACYLMSIHEHLPPEVKWEMKQVGRSKGLDLAKLARGGMSGVRLCNLVAQS